MAWKAARKNTAVKKSEKVEQNVNRKCIFQNLRHMSCICQSMNVEIQKTLVKASIKASIYNVYLPDLLTKT